MDQHPVAGEWIAFHEAELPKGRVHAHDGVAPGAQDIDAEHVLIQAGEEFERNNLRFQGLCPDLCW